MSVASPATASRPLRILYAEDHPVVREVIAEVFASEGHRVTCAADGREAFERFAAQPGGFDLIVTDHQMPYLTGLELAGYLRAADYAGSIVVLTSIEDRAVLEAFAELKVDEILTKPTSLAVLRGVLRRVDRKRSLATAGY
jgi:CheY-like chemotaxis protein